MFVTINSAKFGYVNVNKIRTIETEESDFYDDGLFKSGFKLPNQLPSCVL